jgi:hypothetical protein
MTKFFIFFFTLNLLTVAKLKSAQQSPPADQIREYEAEVPKSIVQLQQFRQTSSIPIETQGGKQSTATLINLNPVINAWYLLVISVRGGTPASGSADSSFHLENAQPRTRRLVLDASYPAGIVAVEGSKRYPCDLFASGALDQAKASRLSFAPLCEGRIFLRNSTIGHRTTLEAATEFLRDRIWGGEKIIGLGHVLLGDAHREKAKMESAGGRPEMPGDLFPAAARIDPKYADRLLTSSNLAMELEGAGTRGMLPGAWYPANGNPGIYVSILQPDLIDPSILQSALTTVRKLDEASSLCYLVAFDLDQFDLGFSLGTRHPEVGWSDHIQARMKVASMPGPDGIGTIQPLVATGLISPGDARTTVATFTGGFKRTHGAFMYGDLALRNHGSHYGFIENGVVFSKLQPDLSTIYVLDDGTVGMKTWTAADNVLLARIKYARQNGVPLVEAGVPGRLVGSWGAGNWSGSADGKLRTMRSGAALQRNASKRFLIYAVFSTATPSAMVRIFQAYGCDYAMLLDMNALEHTYTAVYRRSGSQMLVDHLIKGMEALDKTTTGGLVPRFLGYPDNRDFFYLTRRSGKESKP